MLGFKFKHRLQFPLKNEVVEKKAYGSYEYHINFKKPS